VAIECTVSDCRLGPIDSKMSFSSSELTSMCLILSVGICSLNVAESTGWITAETLD